MNENKATAPVDLRAVPAHTPGWKTTEFWSHNLFLLGVLLASLDGAVPPKYSVIAMAASQVAYNLSRGLAKGGQPK